MFSLRESEKTFRKLQSFPPFENFTNQEFKNLLDNYYERSYKHGQILFSEGDPRTRIYFVLKGVVRLERYDEDADFCYYDYVKRLSLFPYGGMFADEEYHFTAEALTDITVFYIPRKIFEENCTSNPKQLLFMYRCISEILLAHELRVQNCVASSANDRVVKTLEYLRKNLSTQDEVQGEVIPYPITLNELAINSGTTRETAGHVVKQLKHEGKIKYKNKIFAFLDHTKESQMKMEIYG